MQPDAQPRSGQRHGSNTTSHAPLPIKRHTSSVKLQGLGGCTVERTRKDDCVVCVDKSVARLALTLCVLRTHLGAYQQPKSQCRTPPESPHLSSRYPSALGRPCGPGINQHTRAQPPPERRLTTGFRQSLTGDVQSRRYAPSGSELTAPKRVQRIGAQSHGG